MWLLPGRWTQTFPLSEAQAFMLPRRSILVRSHLFTSFLCASRAESGGAAPAPRLRGRQSLPERDRPPDPGVQGLQVRTAALCPGDWALAAGNLPVIRGQQPHVRAKSQVWLAVPRVLVCSWVGRGSQRARTLTLLPLLPLLPWTRDGAEKGKPAEPAEPELKLREGGLLAFLNDSCYLNLDVGCVARGGLDKMAT